MAGRFFFHSLFFVEGQKGLLLPTLFSLLCLNLLSIALHREEEVEEGGKKKKKKKRCLNWGQEQD